MKVISLFIFISILSSTYSQLPKECFEEFKNLTHPYHCCTYPFEILPDITQECQTDCEAFKNITENAICQHDCFYIKSEIYKDNKINDEKIAEAFVLIENGTTDGEIKKWKATIDESIKKCHNYFDWNILEPKEFNNTVPLYLIVFSLCIMQENFINCPEFENLAECNATRDAIEHSNECGWKIGNKKISYRNIWYRWALEYDENSTNEEN